MDSREEEDTDEEDIEVESIEYKGIHALTEGRGGIIYDFATQNKIADTEEEWKKDIDESFEESIESRVEFFLEHIEDPLGWAHGEMGEGAEDADWFAERVRDTRGVRPDTKEVSSIPVVEEILDPNGGAPLKEVMESSLIGKALLNYISGYIKGNLIKGAKLNNHLTEENALIAGVEFTENMGFGITKWEAKGKMKYSLRKKEGRLIKASAKHEESAIIESGIEL